MPDTTLSTLQNIRTKVRRLTRSPSVNQISDNDVNNYINNFVLYDFPEELRLFSLRRTLTFYTSSGIESYATNTATPTDPLYNFKNLYISVHPPAYIAGYSLFFSQSREQFYGIYPNTQNIATIGTGDGATTNYIGTLSAFPILQNNVTFSSTGAAGKIVLVDMPVSDVAGALIVPNDTTVIFGAINYVTGAYAINFPAAPSLDVPVLAQTVPYVAARPQGMLYFNHSFYFRPIPDAPYPVTIEAYLRPTELLQDADQPYLSQWWQYIAYGASKKILEDRMDVDTVSLIIPEFKHQERLALRQSLVQQSNDRSSTIYTEQTTLAGGFGWGSGGLY